jgi:hypothetical protein
MYQTQVGWSSSDQSCRGCGFCGFEYPKPYCFPIPFWYNGYKKGNPKCFYDTLDPPDRITSGWTEELEFAPYKRLPEASILADAEMYISSSPISTAIAEGPKGLVKDTSYAKHRSCASYRLAKWPGRYFDLLTSLGVTPLNLGALDKICYFGGGELYPLVGSLLGNFHPLTGSNYIARRSLEIFSNPNSNRRDYPRRPPRYADQDNVDKLQRLYPDGKASKCFRMNDVDERDKDLFPKDLEREKHMGENRYIYWNKRTACTCEYRGGTHAWEDSPKIDLCSVRKPPTGMIGWGCIAGRDPGGLDIPFPIRPRQSYSDHQLGRGDLFEQNVEGIELPFFMPPFEAAGRLYPWGDFTR